MKRKNFTESKILSIIKQYQGGRAIDDLCRENSISKATVYNWRKKYSGMDGGQVRQPKELPSGFTTINSLSNNSREKSKLALS